MRSRGRCCSILDSPAAIVAGSTEASIEFRT